ncbi:pyridoxamine 5'-phosphate oxidase family protein [Clostridium botulinum]|uniref:pyridoxamine 5'-phosphate oxidase family protein n=1 Tax=Clostridium botulinum TaxID=1491 RepID=UPI0001F84C4D|nr:pyridoxamine 5'-phosphate oxidase family protein [Clostridium botulinum]NFB18858.1 pyridoxamine 5'-phosphate oxidase family protein [Clostridium botulinum]NFB67410.1 pyridoxamine 5'-phosphate oxidase family protein [Clostridium botulinum]NFB98345.1 pyridoxamine 5'-phosphate oxidase family protein [Clostridium botulinum]NFC46549.1 pyridoxamine 5'-phosphate oxidase family protein [Clostridium botulinum]NFC60102.1 pyridoxamine 5'-phosphate oxidase family protein [Clostridium botulinum]
MFSEMRRKDRELKNDEAIEILKNNTYGVLSTISENGYPYGVPISYIFFDNSIYFHSAIKGHKLDNISNNNRVSFCVVGRTHILPDKFSTEYESVIVFGRVIEVSNDEKNTTLLEILNKYSADYIGQGKEYIQKASKATKVMKINIEHTSGKAKR